MLKSPKTPMQGKQTPGFASRSAENELLAGAATLALAPSGLGSLQDLIASLNGFTRTIYDYINAQPSPYSPDVMQIRRKELAINEVAHDLMLIAQEQATQEISDATESLKKAIDDAKAAISQIRSIKKVIGIVAAVLAAAAGVAAGGGVAAVPAIVTLANQVTSAVGTAE